MNLGNFIIWLQDPGHLSDFCHYEFEHLISKERKLHLHLWPTCGIEYIYVIIMYVTLLIWGVLGWICRMYAYIYIYFIYKYKTGVALIAKFYVNIAFFGRCMHFSHIAALLYAKWPPIKQDIPHWCRGCCVT